MKHEVPYITVYGVDILEPFTILTDLLISAVCFYAFAKLRDKRYTGSVYLFFSIFFFTMGVATAVGGIIGHGFLYLWGMEAKIPGWYVSMISVAAFERAAILHAKPLLKNRIGNFFSVLNIVELLTFMTLTFIFVRFIFVEVHAMYGLLVVVFSFELFVLLKTKDEGSKWMLYGVFWAAVSALLHFFRVSLHEWFNYNDIAHLGMAIAIWCFSKGTRKMKMYSRADV